MPGRLRGLCTLGRGANHRPATAEVDRQKIDAERARGFHAVADGVRDIVKLQVEKYPGPGLPDRMDDRWAATGEKLQPDLVERHGGAELLDQPQGGLLFGYIEGDDDRIVHGIKIEVCWAKRSCADFEVRSSISDQQSSIPNEPRSDPAGSPGTISKTEPPLRTRPHPRKHGGCHRRARRAWDSNRL